MKLLRRVGRDSLWLTAARIGAQVLALFTLLLARRLGNTGFGEYTFVITVVFIGNVLTTCGTDMYFIREIAATGDLSRLPAALWIQLGLSVLFIAGTFVLAPLVPNQSSAAVLTLKIYSLSLIPMSFYSVFTTALRGMQRMAWVALLNLAGAVLQALVVLLFLVGAANGLVVLAILLLVAQVINTVLAGLICSQLQKSFTTGRTESTGFSFIFSVNTVISVVKMGHNWAFHWPDVRAVFAASVMLAVLGLLGMFYQKAGLLLLSTLGGATLTGLYSSALRVVEAAKLVHLATLTALYPRMAQPRAAGAVRLSFWLLLAWALALALGLSLLALPVVNLLYGVAFASAAPILSILAWTLVPYTVNAFLSLAFIASHQPRTVGWALTVSLIGLGFFSLFWIPAYGLSGAAWAVLSAEILQAFVLLIQLRR